jgi:hypothetical protein
VSPPDERETRPLTVGMRRLLLLATLLVLLAGAALFVAPERTDEWFAWTVDPPVTAAFLGAAYWASATVEWTSARASSWAHARVAVPSVFTFTALTLAITLIHLDKFHLAADLATTTRAVTWAWIVIYATVPVMMALLWVRQNRRGGVDPPRTHTLPAWAPAACVAMAVVLLGIGAWLLMAPEQVADWWPWHLTALTGRAIGAWFIGLGVSAVSTATEKDAHRARPVAVGAVVLPLLTAVAISRYPDDVAWDSPGTMVLGVLMVAWAVLGAVLLGLGRSSSRSPAPQEVT